MNEMIERVARAALEKLKADDDAYAFCDQRGTIENVTLDGNFDLVELVRVVVVAMREPTTEMMAAAERAEESGDWQTDDHGYVHWQAMIDAALK